MQVTAEEHGRLLAELATCREALKGSRQESARRQRALQLLQGLSASGLLPTCPDPQQGFSCGPQPRVPAPHAVAAQSSGPGEWEQGAGPEPSLLQSLLDEAASGLEAEPGLHTSNPRHSPHPSQQQQQGAGPPGSADPLLAAATTAAAAANSAASALEQERGAREAAEGRLREAIKVGGRVVYVKPISSYAHQERSKLRDLSKSTGEHTGAGYRS